MCLPLWKPLFSNITLFKNLFQFFSDWAISQATIYRRFKELGDRISCNPSRFLQRQVGLEVVHELVEIIGLIPYCKSNYLAKFLTRSNNRIMGRITCLLLPALFVHFLQLDKHKSLVYSWKGKSMVSAPIGFLKAYKTPADGNLFSFCQWLRILSSHCMSEKRRMWSRWEVGFAA